MTLWPKFQNQFTFLVFPAGCSAQVDLVYLVDISGSVEDYYMQLTDFIKNMTAGMNFMFSRARISFTVFAADPFTRFYLNTFTTKRDIMNALKITEVGYQTDLGRALAHVST